MSSSSQPAQRIFAPGTAPSSSQATQYTHGTLSLSSLHPTPITQFHTWFSAAQTTAPQVYQPETCTLSTAHLPSGRVSARFVYLKEVDDFAYPGGRGSFVLYSNWGTSRKAQDIASNPYASLTFWWREVERQVRVSGRTQRLSSEETARYYDLRARGSRIGAWASPQSRVLRPRKERDGKSQVDGEVGEGEDDGREELQERVEETEKRFEGQDKIPVPEFWGGLRIIPEEIEFWQGRDSRLHDRFLYTRLSFEGEGDEIGEGKWKIERLGP